MIIQKTITPTIINETEQALQAFMLKRWLNRYHSGLGRFKLPNVEKWLALCGLIFSGGAWLVYSAIIFLDKVILNGTQKFDYEFWGILTAFMAVFWFLFRYSQTLVNKLTVKSRAISEKSIEKNSHIYAKKTFKNASQQTQPFTAIYEFDGNKIHYFRQTDGQKTHQWTRTIEPHYEMGENFVLFFKKPTAYSPKIFMFIDEQDKQNLIDYLTH